MSQIILPADNRPYVQLAADPGETLSSVDTDGLLELFKGHGALLLRGFSGDLESFRRLAQLVCPLSVFNDSRNRARLGDNQDVQSVNLGTKAFPLHPELSREPWKPDGAFFYCLTPPSRGGATTICDGIAIVRALPAELRRAMAAARIKYVMPTNPELLKYWLGTAHPTPEQLADPPEQCPFAFEMIGGQVARNFTRPLLHRPLFTEDLAFGNFLLFARYLRGLRNYPVLDDGSLVPGEWVEEAKRVSDALTAPIAWQAGDLLILDNSRFMHGRTEVVANDQRLIATYFGYLADAPHNPEDPPDPVWRKPGFIPPPGGLA